ncbi:MAG: DegT/DnrJ/EryC1/StrS aminotransferase family protein [Candidatus Nanopelagicales bacterium]
MIPAARPIIGEDERKAVDAVLASGGLAQGPQVAAFEDEFAAVVDGRRCVAVNSGTSALHMALLALGIGPGDEVIVPSFTFAATANAVSLAGATPVFVDIDLRTFCMDPAAAEAAITERTRAVMPVHLYGHPADMDRLSEIARTPRSEDPGGRRPGPCRAMGRRPCGSARRRRGFQLLPDQEHDLRRGRHGHDRLG